MSGDVGDAQDWPLVVGGDHRAFERVLDRHSDLVYRFVRRRTGDPSLAEDITAHVFLEAWRQRRTVRLLDGSLRSWLLGVAGNLVKRHWRTLARRDRAVARLPRPWSGDHADDVADRVDEGQRLAEVRDRLMALPKAQRDVVLLWAWEGLSYAEIGLALNIPVGTVRSRLSRARTFLGDSDGTVSADRAYHDRKTTQSDVGVEREE